MIHVRQARCTPRGNALAPALLIVGALAISTLVFFFFTRGRIENARSARETAEAANTAERAASAPESPAPEKGPAPGAVAVGAPAVPAAKTAVDVPAVPAQKPFARPVELAQQLARTLATGDLAAAAKMFAPGEAAQQGATLEVLGRIFRDLGYKAGAPEQAQMIGQVENMIRVSVPLISPTPGAPPSRIMLDLERDPRRGWKIAQVRLPSELESALAALPAAQPPVALPATSGAPALPSIATPAGAGHPMAKSFFIVDRHPDALAFASDFVNSLLKLDYLGAKRFVDPEKIPPVKLAALCIVFEEGKYRLADDRALVATVATDTTSWVITRVHSGVSNEYTEFGLEMEKAAEEWRVGGLNLSKLLSDNAKATSVGDVPYSPLVMNPKGGESIALFFELNQAELHPRAQKQLDVVVSILKASPQKKLKIGGYTDALGSDDYNLNLSQRRAVAVKQYFLAHGIPVTQVETTGFGKSLPLSPNVKPDGTDNPEGRSRNRRAEILLDF
jgi:OmpA-OmpF porin, OOP family